MSDKTLTIIGITCSIIMGIVGPYITFKFFKRKIRKFNQIFTSKKSINDFINFLHSVKDDEIFGLDISLEQVYADQFMKEHRISFSEYEKGNLVGGTSVIFQKDDELHIDMRPSSNRIKGHFKITYSGGPQQGWFTFSLKLVKLESIYNNL